jgi:hypothetical protein
MRKNEQHSKETTNVVWNSGKGRGRRDGPVDDECSPLRLFLLSKRHSAASCTNYTHLTFPSSFREACNSPESVFKDPQGAATTRNREMMDRMTKARRRRFGNIQNHFVRTSWYDKNVGLHARQSFQRYISTYNNLYQPASSLDRIFDIFDWNYSLPPKKSEIMLVSS